jgi:hypothetical protein
MFKYSKHGFLVLIIGVVPATICLAGAQTTPAFTVNDPGTGIDIADFRVSGTNLVRIDSNGNLSFGTGTPSCGATTTGAMCLGETSTPVTATVSMDSMRADATENWFMCSFNDAPEVLCNPSIAGTIVSGDISYFSATTPQLSASADFTISSSSHTLAGGSMAVLDMSNGSLAKVPVVAGCTSSADGVVCYDSTSKNTHVRQNGIDGIVGAFASSPVPVSGDVVSESVTMGGAVTLTDSGIAANAINSTVCAEGQQPAIGGSGSNQALWTCTLPAALFVSPHSFTIYASWAANATSTTYSVELGTAVLLTTTAQAANGNYRWSARVVVTGTNQETADVFPLQFGSGLVSNSAVFATPTVTTGVSSSVVINFNATSGQSVIPELFQVIAN